MNKPSHILIFFIFLIAGCLGKEDNPNQKGIVKLGSLEMIAYGSGNPNNGRIQESSTWAHVFKSQATLKITNSATREEFSLVYDPNDLGGDYQLSLPYGDYEYFSEVTGEEYENFLPYAASGSFRLNAPAQEIVLEAESPYGLITVENNNIQPDPVLVDYDPISMNLLGNFYYKYVKKENTPVLEIVESIFKNTIRRNISVSAYKHYNFSVKVSDGSGKVIELIMTDFELIEEEFLVNLGTVPSSYSPTLVALLNGELGGNSGLANFDGGLWSINDSENGNLIYKLNSSTGVIERRVKVTNAINVDWESLAQSDTHLFIGDFGNNSGKRKDLTILKIEISQLLSKDEVTAEKIEFSFSDQTSFEAQFHKTNFDCEAFFYANDSLHLFTKNWVDNKTKYYTLHINPGTGQANLKADFLVDGLVTAADINPNTGDIVLLGYQNAGISSQCFVWLFSGYSGFDFFNGKKSKIFLGSPVTLGQTEGIVLNNNNTGFISSEKIEFGGYSLPAQLYKFDFSSFF